MRRLFRLGRWRPDPAADVEDEVAHHLERTVDELVGEGWSRGAAEQEAHRRFGDIARYRTSLVAIDRSHVRKTRRGDMFDALRSHLSFAFRGILRQPAFTTAVVLTLALGIGVNAAMFGVLDRLLLSPPEHVVDADRVVRIAIARVSPFTARAETSLSLTWPDVGDFREVGAFESVAAFGNRTMTLGSRAEAERVRTQWADATLFPLLGVTPALGRFYGPDEDRLEGAAPVAVLGYGFWERRFGADETVVGQELEIGRQRYTVVGVAPRGFTGPTVDPVDVWLPIRTVAYVEQSGDGWVDARRWYWTQAVARLANGVPPEAAIAEATAAHRAGRSEEVQLERYDPDASVVLASLVAGEAPTAGAEVDVARWLAGVSLLVLLIACANVANLLLLRAARWRRELAVRVALGVSHARLMAQLLVESLVLATLAGAAAFLTAQWAGTLLHRTIVPDLAPSSALAGPRMVAFVVGVSVLAALGSGLLPAFQATRTNVSSSLREGGRGASSARRARSALLVVQVGFSVVLLVGAGLFVRSLAEVGRLDLGFEPDGLVVGSIEAADGAFGTSVAQALEVAAERLRDQQRVEGAATVSLTPFRGLWGRSFQVPGRDSLALERGPYVYAVSEDYFGVMGMRIARGRGFNAADRAAGAAPVTILTEDLARTAFGAEDPIGQCILLEADEGEDPLCATVVGVLADHSYQQLVEEEVPLHYVPLDNPAATGFTAFTLVARARGGDVAGALGVVRDALLGSGAEVRFAQAVPMSDLVGARARSWRVGATLFTLFGALALVVAALGLYSLMAFDVTERRRELGIRAALGAEPGELVGMVVRRGVLLALMGVIVGSATAALLGGFVQELLFRVSPRDPVVLASVAALLLGVAAIASLVPGARATRVSPTEALTAE